MTGGLRKRLESSERLARGVAALAGAYLGLCNRTIRWRVLGMDQLRADLAQGPVLVVMWHARTLMGPLHWPVEAGPLSSLHAASPIGRVSGALQARCGLQPMMMKEGASNMVASRAVLRKARDGVSIALTGDGPEGPVGVVKDAPLGWARKTGLPVYSYAFATSRGRALGTWDRMWLPRPFGRGALVFARFEGDWPEEAEARRAAMGAFLDATVAQADGLIAG